MPPPKRPHGSFRAAIACHRQLLLEMGRCALSDRGRPRHHHRHFVFLYSLSTDEWLRYAEASEHGEFICDLVGAFYWIYDDAIGRYLRTGRCDHRYAHWAAYYRSVQALARRGGVLRVAATIYHGVRAHVRFDLRDALVETCRAHRDRNQTTPDPAALRQALFGAHTDLLFRSVFERFWAETMLTGRPRPAARMAAALEWGLVVAGSIGVRLFQRWRKQAFAEAIDALGALGATEHEAGGRRSTPVGLPLADPHSY